MTSDPSPWLQRWLQPQDEDLLYVDQTLSPAERSLTLEDLDRAVEATQHLAAAQARARELREVQDARLRWAAGQEDPSDES